MPEYQVGVEIHVDRLPTLPAVAMEAIRLMEGEGASFGSVAELLTADQVLASRLLHYANTAAVGSGQVRSIAQAIALLGTNAVRSIILSATIFDAFAPLAEDRQGLTNFWLHGVGVALTARALAERLGFPDPELAYLGGLLHDIGKLVFAVQAPEDFAAFQADLAGQGSYALHAALPIELEKSYFGTSHMDAGRQVTRYWGFPGELVNGIWLHHQPVMDAIPPAVDHLGQLLRFADVLCVTHQVGSSYMLAGRTPCHDHYHFALENLARHHGMSGTQLAEIVAQVEPRLRELGETLGLWDEAAYQQLVRDANRQLGSLSLDLDRHNRELAATNQMLAACGRLARELRPGMELRAAAGRIVEEAQAAFGAGDALCLLREPVAGGFVGVRLAAGLLQEFTLPAQIAAGDGLPPDSIEGAALEQLRQTVVAAGSGTELEKGMVHLLAGRRFLATCFVAGAGSGNSDPVLGELVVDCSAAPHPDPADLHRRFSDFALAVTSQVEKLLLEHRLHHQAEELAAAGRKLEENQRQLFHSHRLATVGQLAAGTAHEINNPLTIISLNVQFLRRLLRQAEVADEVHERLELVEGQVNRISKIIQDLMSYARPAEPRLEASSLQEIVDKVLRVIGDRVSTKEIEIITDFEADLPLVKVDPLQIEQVLMNLLVNACHAMPKGGRITIRGRNRGATVETAVSDTGTGIDPKNLGKIFDPFFTTKKEGEGTGLGLAICHQIVEHNGGALWVDSEVGRGTTFTMALPVDRGQRLRALKEATAAAVRPAAQPAGPQRPRILVVDDEQILNEMLRAELRRAGYEADGALDGEEGLLLLRRRKYDLVLLDIRMPRKDGLEVLEVIREEFPGLKVIIVTGLASKKEIAETVKMGAFACLKKPFQLERVLETIQRALKAPNRSRSPSTA